MSALFVVATPIGNLSDLSERARDILHACDIVVAEDTRRTRQLLSAIGTSARLISLNEHNASKRIGPILDELATSDVALVSDAGTPAISDPGAQLIEAAHQAGISVHPIPGPSAVVAALSVAGLEATPFTFLGYSPRAAGGLRRWIEDWTREGTTVVFFEAPTRIRRTLALISDLAPNATIVICRELTKLHEQVVRATAADVARLIDEGSIPAKGEFVIVARAPKVELDLDVDSLLKDRLERGMRPNQAAKEVAVEAGLSKSELYKRALELRSRHSD